MNPLLLHLLLHPHREDVSGSITASTLQGGVGGGLQARGRKLWHAHVSEATSSVHRAESQWRNWGDSEVRQHRSSITKRQNRGAFQGRRSVGRGGKRIKREDAVSSWTGSCSFTSPPPPPMRDPPLTLNALKFITAVYSEPFGWFAARPPCLLYRSAVRSFCAPSSSCFPCPADRCRTAKRCAQCSTPCIRAPSGFLKTQFQVSVSNSKLVRYWPTFYAHDVWPGKLLSIFEDITWVKTPHSMAAYLSSMSCKSLPTHTPSFWLNIFPPALLTTLSILFEKKMHVES